MSVEIGWEKGEIVITRASEDSPANRVMNWLGDRGDIALSKPVVEHLLVREGEDTIFLVLRLSLNVFRKSFVTDYGVVGMVDGKEVCIPTERVSGLFDSDILGVALKSIAAVYSEEYTRSLKVISINKPDEKEGEVVSRYVPKNILSNRIQYWLGDRVVTGSIPTITVRHLFTRKNAFLFLVEVSTIECDPVVQIPLDYWVIGRIDTGEEVCMHWKTSGEWVEDRRVTVARIVDVKETTIFLELLSGRVFSKTLTKKEG